MIYYKVQSNREALKLTFSNISSLINKKLFIEFGTPIIVYSIISGFVFLAQTLLLLPQLSAIVQIWLSIEFTIVRTAIILMSATWLKKFVS